MHACINYFVVFFGARL